VVLRPSSLTLPSVSVLVCSLWRMERRLLPSCPMMVAWTTSRKMYILYPTFQMLCSAICY
jgi:hypothetical protein